MADLMTAARRDRRAKRAGPRQFRRAADELDGLDELGPEARSRRRCPALHLRLALQMHADALRLLGRARGARAAARGGAVAAAVPRGARAAASAAAPTRAARAACGAAWRQQPRQRRARGRRVCGRERRRERRGRRRARAGRRRRRFDDGRASSSLVPAPGSPHATGARARRPGRRAIAPAEPPADAGRSATRGGRPRERRPSAGSGRRTVGAEPPSARGLELLALGALHHWTRAGRLKCGAIDVARCHWLLSRSYCVLGNAAGASRHADLCALLTARAAAEAVVAEALKAEGAPGAGGSARCATRTREPTLRARIGARSRG